MSTQDQLEKTLRKIHILISKGDPYDDSQDKVIVSKHDMIALLNDLNEHVYQMMDDYELTKQSRDKAERECKRRGDKLMKTAEQKAEDVYAASVLYTNEALNHIQHIIDEANESMKDIFLSLSDEIKHEKNTVKENQKELEGQLHDMVDTKKYLQMIMARNKELELERGQVKKQTERKDVVAKFPKPEIKIDKAYFERNNIPLEEENAKDIKDKEKIKETPKIKVNENANYFKWREKTQKRKQKVQVDVDLNKEDLS